MNKFGAASIIALVLTLFALVVRELLYWLRQADTSVTAIAFVLLAISAIALLAYVVWLCWQMAALV